jgi:hypothetical protein
VYDEYAGEEARGGVSYCAYLMGYWYDDEGRLWTMQERVRAGLWNFIATEEDERLLEQLWDSPSTVILDAGTNNIGVREGTEDWVVCDWGLESIDTLLEIGQEAQHATA